MMVTFDNTTRNGAAWGFHLNILVSRNAFDDWKAKSWLPLFRQWIPFVVTSPGLLGAGKLGSENGKPACIFQMAQRADHFDKLIGLETVSSKSLINTRDESLAHADKWARFHIIAFDTNQFELANFLKFGVTQLLFALVEEQCDLPDLTLRCPLETFVMASRDLSFKQQFELAGGRKVSALEIQYLLAEAVGDSLKRGSAACEVPDATHIHRHWLRTLDALARADARLARQLDWRARLEFINRARNAHPQLSEAAALADVTYGKVDGPYESLERKGLVDRLEDFLPPPHSTTPAIAPRDRLRAKLIERWGDRVMQADWDHLIMVDADDQPWLVDLGDPLHGSHLVMIAERARDLPGCLQQLQSENVAKRAVLMAAVGPHAPLALANEEA